MGTPKVFDLADGYVKEGFSTDAALDTANTILYTSEGNKRSVEDSKAIKEAVDTALAYGDAEGATRARTGD